MNTDHLFSRNINLGKREKKEICQPIEIRPNYVNKLDEKFPTRIMNDGSMYTGLVSWTMRMTLFELSCCCFRFDLRIQAIYNSMRRKKFDQIMTPLNLQNNLELDCKDRFSKVRTLITFM